MHAGDGDNAVYGGWMGKSSLRSRLPDCQQFLVSPAVEVVHPAGDMRPDEAKTGDCQDETDDGLEGSARSRHFDDQIDGDLSG